MSPRTYPAHRRSEPRKAREFLSGSVCAEGDADAEMADVDQCGVKLVGEVFEQSVLVGLAQAAAYAGQLQTGAEQLVHRIAEQLPDLCPRDRARRGRRVIGYRTGGGARYVGRCGRREAVPDGRVAEVAHVFPPPQAGPRASWLLAAVCLPGGGP